MKVFQFRFFNLLMLLATINCLSAQTEIIYLENPSFEDDPRSSWQPNGWIDCGFPGESAPDVQPFGGFGVTQPAQHEQTYLGLVVRDNKTWECVSQRLTRPIKQGECYKFSIYLSRSAQYVSYTKKDPNALVNFNRGTVLRVYGGNGPRDRAELLATTDEIKHTDWKQYKLEFNPKNADYRYIFLEAYYKTPTMFYYNGNLLLDNASEIYSCEIPDPDTPVLAEVIKDDKRTNVKPGPKDPKKDPFSNPKEIKEDKKDENRGNFDPNIKASELEVGYTFRLENLYFQADSSNISSNAGKVLSQVVSFMKKNPKISIEIGGHTNGLPKHDYCDKLSSSRAKNVSLFLIRNGVDRRRITHKGYGKRKPIADNDTDQGKRLNQRVEIKITRLD